MMFAGRRQAPEAFTLRITQDDIPVVFLFKIFADFVQTGINSMAICLISFSGSSANFVKWLC